MLKEKYRKTMRGEVGTGQWDESLSAGYDQC